MDAVFSSGRRWCWAPQNSDEAIYDDTLGVLGRPDVFKSHPDFHHSVTVVIPTHRAIPIGIDAFLADSSVKEILILSNGSFKGSFEPKSRVRVHSCHWEGHGQTRQASLTCVNTPYVLFSVDDAVPVGGGFVSRLLSQLDSGRWDAVVGRQIPWPSAPLYLHRRMLNWMPPGNRTIAFSQADHVATLYRRETLESSPLPAVDIAEDLMWSIGKSIGLVQDALILHSHPPSIRALWRREVQIEAVRCRLNCQRRLRLMDLAAHSLGAASRRDWASLVYEGTEASAQWLAQRRFSLRQPRA